MKDKTWIPAFAGMTTDNTQECHVLSVLIAAAGMSPSRRRGQESSRVDQSMPKRTSKQQTGERAKNFADSPNRPFIEAVTPEKRICGLLNQEPT
jgi:hypothetical protein